LENYKTFDFTPIPNAGCLGCCQFAYSDIEPNSPKL